MPLAFSSGFYLSFFVVSMLVCCLFCPAFLLDVVDCCFVISLYVLHMLVYLFTTDLFVLLRFWFDFFFWSALRFSLGFDWFS